MIYLEDRIEQQHIHNRLHLRHMHNTWKLYSVKKIFIFAMENQRSKGSESSWNLKLIVLIDIGMYMDGLTQSMAV